MLPYPTGRNALPEVTGGRSSNVRVTAPRLAAQQQTSRERSNIIFSSEKSVIFLTSRLGVCPAVGPSSSGLVRPWCVGRTPAREGRLVQASLVPAGVVLVRVRMESRELAS